mgnify:CR=1 FL=1
MRLPYHSLLLPLHIFLLKDTRKKFSNKGFFILPLKTAINAIFDRVKNKIIQNEKIEERISLLHSDTTSYYLKESTVEEDKVIEYTNKGKQFSLPLTISTLDQIFNFVYKYNGFELKLATLSYSKIVIDEIQAYSPDLLAYLVYGLEKITEVGGKFAILTATLPPFIKDYLKASQVFGAWKTMNIITYIRETDARYKGIDNPSTDEGELMKELIFKILH